MAAPGEGKTLWEMLKEKLSGNGASLSFYNPLELRPGAAVPVGQSRAEFGNFDFSVKEIREYTRRLSGQVFRFSDYVLAGVQTKSFAAEDNLTLRLRAVPSQAGGHNIILLELDDEFGFDPGFMDVVKDTTGVFEINDEKSGQTDRFNRVNDVKDSYEAVVMVVRATNDDGSAARGSAGSERLEYWDYWREAPIAQGEKTKKQFLFVEMNSDTGWFQLWRGGEFFL